MIFRETSIAGVWVVEPERYVDERGFFARTWDARELAERGLNGNLVQCSISYNRRRGTLRGMHLQASPHEEAKLVRCTAGAIFDVALDLRPGSATFAGGWGESCLRTTAWRSTFRKAARTASSRSQMTPRSRTRSRRAMRPNRRVASAGTIRSSPSTGRSRSR